MRVVLALLLLFSSASAQITWSEVPASGGTDKKYISIACDTTGRIVLMGDSTRLWLSKNYGLTTAETRPAGDSSKYWQCVGVFNGGAKLLACAWDQYSSVSYGCVYISNDTGAIWTKCNMAETFSSNWFRCGGVASGDTLFVGDYNHVGSHGYFYKSVNGGAAWTNWFDLNLVYASAMPYDVFKYLHGKYGGRLYYGDIAAPSTEIYPPGGAAANKNWFCAGISGNAQGRFAGIGAGPSYYSSDAGANWTNVHLTAGDSVPQWMAFGRGAGTMLWGTVTRLYFSDDSLRTIEEQMPAGNMNLNWKMTCMSANAAYLYAVAYDGRAWKGTQAIAPETLLKPLLMNY